jgi:hypothetical protein
MANKEVISRHTSWICTQCNITGGQKNNQTSQSAELHADQEGHRVIMSGMAVYDIKPGSFERDDPFDPRT